MLATLKYYIYFFKNYIYLGYICIFTDRKKFKQFSVAVNDFRAGYELSEKAKILKTIELTDLLDPAVTDGEIIINDLTNKQGNATLFELYCICSVAKYMSPAQVFEIGTFDGRTTLHIALNTGEKTKIQTLDVPPEDLGGISLKLDPGDPQLVDKKGFSIGQRFLDRNESGKIKQSLSDSAKFEFSPFEKQVDLFFIDGAHSYEYVKSDTENALKCLKPDGIILWHDYGSVLGVTNYLNELSKSLPVYRISNTTLAVNSAKLKNRENC